MNPVTIITNRKYENGVFFPTDIDVKTRNVGSKAVQHGKVPYARVVNRAGDKFVPEEDNLFDHDETVNQSRVDKLAQSERVLLFVHGFNITIQDAANRGKDLATASGLPVIVFDWPAEGRILLPLSIAKAYAKDSETANGSRRPLEWLINTLLTSKNVKELYVLGHSMGARIVVAALSSIAHDYHVLVRADKLSKSTEPSALRQSHWDRFKKLRLLILKQADLDVRTLTRFLLNDVDETACGEVEHKNFAVVAYVHGADKSLEFSQDIHYGKPRVGQKQGGEELREELPEVPTLKIIDASACGTAWWITPKILSPQGNHSYFEDAKFIASFKDITDPTFCVSKKDSWSVL